MASSRMGSQNPPPASRPTVSPRLAAVVRGVAPRKSVISRLTQFSRPPVSVVPYAPERLSITQTAMTPEMMRSIADKGAQRDQVINSRKEDSVTTLFAALRMRRVLHRVQAEHEQSGPRLVIDETKANLERHLKVLSRYKIRQVDTDADERLQLRNLPPFMVNPHSTWYKVWQLVTLVIIIYQSIMLPFALAFGSNDTTVVDILMSSIFAMDIVVAFNTPVAEDSDETAYILNRWHIASNYIRGWFFFDLLACMPFDYVLLLVNNSKSNLSVLGLLKALRVPRLLRLVRLLRVAKVFKMRPELRRWLQYSRHANLLRLVRLVVSFLVINHYVACFWFGLVMSAQTRALDPSTDSAHLYVVAFYQSLLVVMGQNITVYEDTEYIFCVLAMVVGAVLMAVVFGNVAILIANYYESQSSHQKKMEWLFASMNRMKLPYDLQNRINAYYQAMWERHGTLDGAVTAFIPELSRNLGYEVELFLRMDMINRAPIFQNCSAKVVQELVMELELQVFMPGDYVVVRGEVGNDMYFVQNGICEVTKEVDVPPAAVSRNPSRLSQASQAAQAVLHRKGSGLNRESNSGQNPPPPSITKSKEVVLKVLGQGDYFGEIALLMNCKRTANVRAQVFSELCTLTREVFESISQRYLEDRNIIEKFIMDKYDPSMLQAAMKQSQEVSMRSAGPAAAAAAAATRPGNGFFKSSNTGPSGSSHAMSFGEATSRAETATAKITGLLTKVLQRIDRLEEQLGKEAEARRESETRLRHTLTEATKRINSRSPTSSLVDQIPKHPGALRRFSVKAVADEPERVSQRNLLAKQLAELEAKEARTASIDEPIESSAKVAPSDSPDDFTGIRRRSSLKALRSWRNLRNEGLLGLRLRTGGSKGSRLSQIPGIGAGVGAVGAGGSFRRSSSRSNSRHSSTRSTARANDSYIDPKLLKPEPDVRSGRESDDENADQFPSDLLDDLARSLDPQQTSGNT